MANGKENATYDLAHLHSSCGCATLSGIGIEEDIQVKTKLYVLAQGYTVPRWLTCSAIAKCLSSFTSRLGTTKHSTTYAGKLSTMKLTIVIVSDGTKRSYVQVMITGMMMEGRQRTNTVQPTSQADGAWKRSQDILGTITHHTSPAAGSLCKAIYNGGLAYCHT